MKTLFKLTNKVLVLGLIFGFISCSSEEESISIDSSVSDLSTSSLNQRSSEKINIFKGPMVQYGSGKARSWISINHKGFPVEIGIELTAEVLDDLSLLNTGHEETSVLPLHQKAKESTPFEHIGLNFQPDGHGPVFWNEHFDLHFYTITNEERLAIPPYDPGDPSIVDGYNYFPDMTKMPQDYFKFPFQGGAFAMMGKHWVPSDWATGYNPFTHVMILGTYAQKNNFMEPMVTTDFLLSGEEFSGYYSQPQTFEEPGNNYPTKYNIYHDDKTGNIYITLSDFVKR